LIQEGKLTKPIITYIAGVVAEVFPESPQFGHAKAMASTKRETARAKRDALREAGAQVAESFAEFVDMMSKIPSETVEEPNHDDIMKHMEDRKHALISTSISRDEDGQVKILGQDLLPFAQNHSFGYIVASMFLGKQIKSAELEEYINFILKLLVDHGPYVSGAVNTIVTSRAGRDLVSSLSAGLLTVGPRFGGAINEAASNWIEGVESGKSATEFVEDFASRKKYILGIGHKKYRVDMPDPRVTAIKKYTEGLEAKYTKFALSIEKVTVAKKGNLILNVDGAIAAVLLDILSEKEGYSQDELKELVETEFFNGLFVLSRSVGFISHFLDQKRMDEGLFRLEEEHVADASGE
jgi:citrate synthase